MKRRTWVLFSTLVAGAMAWSYEVKQADAQSCVPAWTTLSPQPNGNPGVAWSAPTNSATQVQAIIQWDPDGPGPRTPVIVVGGQFDLAGGTSASRVAAYDPASGQWEALGTGAWTSSGAVTALAVLPTGELVAGGTFFQAGGVSASMIAKWNGTAWGPLGGGLSGLGGQVMSLLVLPNGDMIACGTFTGANNGLVTANRIARWDGATWSGFGAGMNNTVDAVAALPNGDLIAGGFFTTAGGVAVNRIARWNGSAWSPLGSGMNNRVRALLATPSGDVIAGGEFTTAGGVSTGRVALWNGSQWSRPIPASSPSSTVRAMAFDASGALLIGGTSTAVWRSNGTAYQQLGASFGPTTTTVHSLLTLPSGDILAGGGFTRVGSLALDGIARYAFSGPSPQVAASPQAKRVPVGTSAVFSCTPVTGFTDLTATWHLEDAPDAGTYSPLSPGPIAGADGAIASIQQPLSGSGQTALTIIATTAALDGRRVYAVIANACGNVTSQTAALTVYSGAPACNLDYDRNGVRDSDDLGAFITDYYTEPAVPGPGGYAVACPGAQAPYDAGYTAAYTSDGAGQCGPPYPDNLGDFITDYFGATNC